MLPCYHQVHVWVSEGGYEHGSVRRGVLVERVAGREQGGGSSGEKAVHAAAFVWALERATPDNIYLLLLFFFFFFLRVMLLLFCALLLGLSVSHPFFSSLLTLIPPPSLIFPPLPLMWSWPLSLLAPPSQLIPPPALDLLAVGFFLVLTGRCDSFWNCII